VKDRQPELHVSILRRHVRPVPERSAIRGVSDRCQFQLDFAVL
jgi:hypothetical protein